MPCFHAKPAWQAHLGGKLSFTFVRGWRPIMAPCATCIGCRKAHAQAWAYRCHLEATLYEISAFLTLTYDDHHCPWTLNYDHFQRFIRALRQRSTEPLRFFMSAEYGSRRKRPHYHAILFGFNPLGAANQTMVERSWGRGQIQCTPVTPRRIAYCARYTDKKVDDDFHSHEYIDPDTGELWQPPFIKMSLKPGLGSHARDKWPNMWRLFAVHNGVKFSVPRYLHKRWRDTATDQDLQQLQAEREKYALTRNAENYLARTAAAEAIALKKQLRAAELATL